MSTSDEANPSNPCHVMINAGGTYGVNHGQGEPWPSQGTPGEGTPGDASAAAGCEVTLQHVTKLPGPASYAGTAGWVPGNGSSHRLDSGEATWKSLTLDED